MSSLERDFTSAMREIEREKLTDPWGLHASHLAHGIEKSGLPAILGDLKTATHAQTAEISQGFSAVEQRLGTVESATWGVRDAVIALAAVNAAGFAEICQHLGETNNLLGNIEDLLANPLSTAAAERYRRGVHALTQGWPDLALGEFDAAIEQDPFQAISHFSRGLALGALGRDGEAAAAFADAVRFTGKDRNLDPVAAGAAVLAAQAYERLADRQRAIEIAAQVRAKVGDTYAELLFALGRLTNDTAVLRRAFEVAPELAAVAVAVDVPDARMLAQEVYEDADGPIQPMIRAVQTAQALGHAVTMPATAPETMTFHRVWVRGVSQQVEHFARAEIDRADGERQTAAANAQAANSVKNRKFSGHDSLGTDIVLAVMGLVIGGFVFRTGLTWLEYFQDPDTDKPGRALLSLLALPLGGVILLFGIWAAFQVLADVRRRQQAASTHAQAVRAAAAQAAASAGSASLQSERAAQAQIILELIAMSRPRRHRTMLSPG